MKKKAEVIVADIGSTLTKLCAYGQLDSNNPQFLGQGIGLTSVRQGDISIGLDEARADLENRLNVDTRGADLMAASSAAGGLKMSVHGLTVDMTLRAAREASLGAGAIVGFTTASYIQDSDVAEILRQKPDIIMLAGGVDYGDRDVVVTNARLLARLDLDVPIIYAGNISARAEVKGIIEEAGKIVIVVDNVYPKIDELNIVPVRTVIQNVFSEHIITAPRMEKVKSQIVGDVIPTPGAVMRSAEILYEAIGDLVVVDVGGATSDVHSVTDGSKKFAKMMVAPEPKAKRTVEGDLGVYINAANIIEASTGAIAPFEAEPLPAESSAKEKSAQLAKWAVDLSLWRHAGEVKIAYGAYGRNELVEGKDLTAVKYVIGTGGALTQLGVGSAILGSVRQDPRGCKLLPPKDTPVLLDRHYIMATAGVLSQIHKKAAKKMLLASIGL
ncbi:MAG: hypothetical protein ACI8ZB_004554 [Desulforhopalus sp.]|jgi:uncharacterized protein (TIGR01319 family)